MKVPGSYYRSDLHSWTMPTHVQELLLFLPYVEPITSYFLTSLLNASCTSKLNSKTWSSNLRSYSSRVHYEILCMWNICLKPAHNIYWHEIHGVPPFPVDTYKLDQTLRRHYSSYSPFPFWFRFYGAGKFSVAWSLANFKSMLLLDLRLLHGTKWCNDLQACFSVWHHATFCSCRTRTKENSFCTLFMNSTLSD